MKKLLFIAGSFGFLGGAVLAGWAYYHLNNLYGRFPGSLLELVLFFIFIFSGILVVRNRVYQKQISYGPALFAGVIITVIISIIMSLANYNYYQADLREIRKVELDAILQQKHKEGLKGDKLIEEANNQLQISFDPAIRGKSTFAAYILFGLAFSLISASILRRPSKPIEFKQ